MEIQILLAGVEFGPYTDDKARQLIAEGFLSATDPAKRLDETEWLPLTEVLAREKVAPADQEPEEEEQEQERVSSFSEEPADFKFASPLDESFNFSPLRDEVPAEESILEAMAPVLEPESTFETKPEPAPVTRTAHVERTATQTAPLSSHEPSRTRATAKASGPSPTATAAFSAPPLVNVVVPSRAKAKGVGRTGSLLAKEALQAARARLGAVAPAITAPLPPPPKTSPDASPTLVKPQAPVAALSAPSAVPAPAVKTAAAPVSSSAPPSGKPRSKIVLKTGDRAEPATPKARRTIKLTQPVSLGVIAPPEPPASPVPSPAPKLAKLAPQAPERPPITGKIRIGQTTNTMPLRVERKTNSLQARTTSPVLPPVEEKPIVTPPLAQEDQLPASATESAEPPAVEAPEHEIHPPHEEDTRGPESSFLTESKALSPSLTSSGDLAEKRSLKITGALKQPTPRTPVRLTPTVPYKPGDSGKVGLRTEEKTEPSPSQPFPTAKKIWGPESPTSRRIPPPTAKVTSPVEPLEAPRLHTRPPSTKIPVSEMPPEGLKVRSTRRLTGRIPIPGPPKLPPELPPPEVIEPAPLETSEPVTQPGIYPETTAPTETAAPVETFAPLETIQEPATPIEPVEPETAPPADVAQTLAPTPDVAKPEKIRMRRPVKLELSSRKADSGRITLEDFAKMSSVEVPPKVIPPLPPLEPEELGSPPSDTTLLTPGETGVVAETVPIAPLERLKQSRQIRILQKASPTPATPKQKWLWVAYAIIALGMLAFLLLLYLANFRRPAASASTTPASQLAPGANPVPAPAPASATASNPPAPPPVNGQVSAYIAAGKDSFQKGSLDDALTAFNHALDLDPKSAEALYNRGLTKSQQDDSDGAIADFSQALQIDPRMSEAYYARGLARHSKGDLDGALGDYNLAVQADPKQAMAFFNRGLIRMQKDDIDGAIVDSGKALDLDPKLVQCYYNRGLGRLAKGSLDAALSDMTTFCTLAPQEAFTDYAHLYVWLIRTQQNQLAEANQELTQAMNSGWNASADAMVTKLGEFLLGQISEDDLIAASASAVPVTEQGQRCEAWYFIGMRRLEAGDKDAAAIDLRKCVETQKTDYCEYILAQEELKTLNPGGPVTSQ